MVVNQEYPNRLNGGARVWLPCAVQRSLSILAAGLAIARSPSRPPLSAILTCMSHTCYRSERLENLAGAWALAVDDVQRKAVDAVAGHGGSVPSALVTLGAFPGQTIEELRNALGLTHSGAVRLVDRLVEAGWLERRPGVGGRALSLVLTPGGREAGRKLLRERGKAIASLLEPLCHADQVQLEGLLEKMLASRASTRRDARHVCRLCERQTCPPCPVSRAALGKDDPLKQ